MGRSYLVRLADLDAAAVAQRLDRQLICWYAFRAADAPGTGRVSQDQIKDVFRWLGWSTRLSARVLKGGAETFWRVTPRQAVYLHGPAAIATALRVTSFRAAFRGLLADLRGTLGVVRPRLVLQAVAALREGGPVSNATIAEMADVDVRTIRRWRKISHVRSFENFVLVAPLRPGTIAGDFRALGGPALRTVQFRGRRWLARRLPDSFQTPNVGGRSRLRRVNLCLRLLAGAASSASSDGGHTRRRVYALGHEHRAPAAASRSLTVYHPLTPLGVGRRSRHPVWVWAPRSEERGGHFVHGVGP